LPFILPFLFSQFNTLINFVVALQAQSRNQIVIRFDSPALTATPVCVRRLDHIARPTGLTFKACHQFQQLF
jgi:hypothetical protein